MGGRTPGASSSDLPRSQQAAVARAKRACCWDRALERGRAQRRRFRADVPAVMRIGSGRTAWVVRAIGSPRSASIDGRLARHPHRIPRTASDRKLHRRERRGWAWHYGSQHWAIGGEATATTVPSGSPLTPVH